MITMEPSRYEKILRVYTEHDHHDHDDHPIFHDRNHQPNASDPKRLAFRNRIGKRRDELKERCCKHLLLDIYVHALPMDDGCAEGQLGRYEGDVKAMLASKGTTATQYFKSAAAETKAPLLEYVNRYVDMVGQQFMEKAEKEAEEAEEEGTEPTELPDSEVDEAEIENQLVEVKKDIEYEDFIEKLKRKTIKKIVADISSMINDKKDEEEMTFSPQTESAFIQTMNYISETMIKENCEPDWGNDDLMELAVRESTLFSLNECFNLTDRTLDNFRQGLALGKGLVVTESAVVDICQQYGYLGESHIDGYLQLMTENVDYLDQVASDFFSEGVIEAVGRGAKAVWEWLKRLVAKIKSFFSGKAKGDVKSQVEEINRRAAIKQDIFRDAGIEVKVASNPPAKSPSTASQATGSASFSTKTAESMAKKAGDGLVVHARDGGIISDGQTCWITFHYNIQVFDTDRYREWLEKNLMPAIRSGFKDKALIEACRRTFGETGNTIPIFRDRRHSVNDIFGKANEMIDYLDKLINSEAVRKLKDSPDVDPYFGIMLNGIGMSVNMLNLMLRETLDSLITNYDLPFTADEIAAVKNRKDLGKLVEAIITKVSDVRGFKGGPYAMTKPLIRAVAKHNGWIINEKDVSSGASRATVMESDQTKDLYKYAWNKKGIIDNKLDLKIKSMCTPEMAKFLALPTEESSTSGAYVVVPRAKPAGNNVSAGDLAKRFNDAASKAGVKLTAKDLHAANIGMLNGQPTVIDYGNFLAN